MTVTTKFEVGEIVTAHRPANQYWTEKKVRFEIGQIRILTLNSFYEPSRYLIEYRATRPLGTWFAEGWLTK